VVKAGGVPLHQRRRPSTVEASWTRLLRYLGHWSAFNFGFFAVIDKADGCYCGECGLMDFRREVTPPLDGAVEAGWTLDPAVWGKGIATEAMTAAIDWYGARPDAKSLVCIIAPANTPSIRLAAKLGFVLDGEARYRDQTLGLYRRS
jgi:RimJ/RimL family protein N-acetyltransferase